MQHKSAFTARRVNKTTFVIVEDDKYGELPYIYVKLHPDAPLVILNDTGCDAPREPERDGSHIGLRQFIETVPLSDNDGKPLNAGGQRTYIVILSHCHYDHIGGIEQFAHRGRNQIIASAAGRDFIESDLPAHSLCKYNKIETPRYKVTHWAQSNERLSWPLARGLPGDDAERELASSPVDLNIRMFHTPGHTPDSLAWFDEAERTMYIGDSLYQLGQQKEPIIFPTQGDLIDWGYSMGTLAAFIQLHDNVTATVEDEEWLAIESRIKLSCSHTTYNAPASEVVFQARILVEAVMTKKKRPVLSQERFGEIFDYYVGDNEGGDVARGMTLLLPRRLVDDARRYLNLE